MSSRIPRLAYGFLSASTDPINIKLPWSFSNRDGMFKMNYLPQDAARDSLKFWANTNKGEYIMDFEFGLDVRRHIFSPAIYLKDNVTNNANEQFPKYFPSLKMKRFEIITSEDSIEVSPNQIIVILEATSNFDKNNIIKLQEKIGA